MTASALAERAGVSPGAISQHELRNVEPHAQTLSRIAEVLGLPEAYFLRQGVTTDPANHWYRSQSAATKKARESAEARYRWLREIVAEVERRIDFPKNLIASVTPPSDPLAIGVDYIESLAADLRAEWKLGDGPIPNVISLLETLGCIVGVFAFGSEELSAFSQFAPERPYVLLNAEEAACVRLRFNASHELAHLIIHRNIAPQEAARPAIHKQLEAQAHRFAAAFLFPARSFAEEVYSTSLDALVQVKSRWRVSMQMVIRRARDLDLVSQDRYERCFRELSRRGYRTREPMDDSLQAERPRMLAKSINLLIDKGVATRDGLLHRVPLSQPDIEVLAGLPRGFFSSEEWGEVSEIKLRQSPPQNEEPSQRGSGQVIPFRTRPS